MKKGDLIHEYTHWHSFLLLFRTDRIYHRASNLSRLFNLIILLSHRFVPSVGRSRDFFALVHFFLCLLLAPHYSYNAAPHKFRHLDPASYK